MCVFLVCSRSCKIKFHSASRAYTGCWIKNVTLLLIGTFKPSCIKKKIIKSNVQSLLIILGMALHNISNNWRTTKRCKMIVLLTQPQVFHFTKTHISKIYYIICLFVFWVFLTTILLYTATHFFSLFIRLIKYLQLIRT